MKKNLKSDENFYKEKLKLDPKNVEAYNNLGVIFLQSGNCSDSFFIYYCL